MAKERYRLLVTVIHTIYGKNFKGETCAVFHSIMNLLNNQCTICLNGKVSTFKVLL